MSDEESQSTSDGFEDDLEDDDPDSERIPEGSGAGCASALYGLGAALAIVLSWQTFHAIAWAILAGLLSWIYVLYYVIAHWTQVKFF